jgi:hypothetical protein
MSMAARRVLLVLATALALAAALPALAFGATWDVNTTADNGAADQACAGQPGDCSIRQAAAAAADGDTINIPSGHYTLDPAKHEIIFDTAVNVVGAGNPVIDGGGITQVLEVNVESGATVTISGVTVTGGGLADESNEGGGIVAFSGLTLTNSTVRDNVSSSAGGGIIITGFFLDPATLRVVNSTISGNTAQGRGGGIYNELSVLKMVNSTVVGNTVGAVGNGGDGGGVYNFSNPFVEDSAIYSSTIADNTAVGEERQGGNIFVDSDDVIAARVPGDVAGGKIDGGPLRMRNTIVADGHAESGPNCGGTDPVTDGHNLISNSECGQNPGAGDITAQPNLKPLSDQGGPTLTRSLNVGSPAINAGDPDGCADDNGLLTSDQRGDARPQGGRCDIGAVEFTPPVSTTGDADSITETSANIHGGSANAHVSNGTSFFQWGTTTAYEKRSASLGKIAAPRLDKVTDTNVVPAGATGQPETAALSGLTGQTTYHYRLVVVNDDDTSFGEDRQFTTPAGTTPPPIGTPRKPRLRLTHSSAGCVRTRYGARVSVSVARTANLRRVDVKLDGHRILRTKRHRFGLRIRTGRLKPGAHVVRIVAVDSNGRTDVLRRIFRRCARTAPSFTG